VKPRRLAELVREVAGALEEALTHKEKPGEAPPAQASPPGEGPGERPLPPYLTCVRKECRLRPDQLDALTALARKINRKRNGKGERITENTLIRWAADMLLDKLAQEKQVLSGSKKRGLNMREELREHLKRIASRIASFEDQESQHNRPAGSASGGSRFEKEVSQGVADLITLLCKKKFARLLRVQKESLGPFPRRLKPAGIDVVAIESLSTKRCIVLDLSHITVNLESCSYQATTTIPDIWLKKAFPVEEWYDLHIKDVDKMGVIPKEHEEARFGDPKRIPFAETKAYKQIYRGLKTKFDGVILFIERDQLLNKNLVEIKSAKSSDKHRIDGNAHERFSYQNLDYVESPAKRGEA